MALGDFAAQAACYAARPGYPGALVERLMARVGVTAGDRVADLGAGTGIFTELLAARGLLVDAVEPSPAMSDQAGGRPGVIWHPGRFEATGLADRSVRWVTAAQAFHWADRPRALPELHRILTAGGHLTALWNDRQDAASPVLSAVMAAIRASAPRFGERYRDRDWGGALLEGGWFGELATDVEPHVVVMTRDRFRALWRSHNHLAESAGAELPTVLAAIDAVTEQADTVEVPYLTRAWTVRAAARG